MSLTNTVYWILSISKHQTAAHWETRKPPSSSSQSLEMSFNRDGLPEEPSSSLSVSDSVSSSSSGGLRRFYFGGSSSTSESSPLPGSKVGCLDLDLVVPTNSMSSSSSSSEESSSSSEEAKSTLVSRAFNVLRRCRTGRVEGAATRLVRRIDRQMRSLRTVYRRWRQTECAGRNGGAW